ncbi:UrcA family protein [Novosphingobium terrae]|uniref:UrcA family protein n=1 Tax=Novosphingobium terrae TaxID=2726189 RepID=UPI00197FEBB1|nr:UrcA family protein [Novosphingobium terrae]
MFNTIRTAAPRFLAAAAASSAVVATFALGMAPMAAHAATAPDTTVFAPQAPVEINDNGAPSLRVSYADLDLSNAADRNEMNRRVTHAATRVCAPLRGSTMDVERSIAYQNCRADAISQAVARIENSAD